MKRIVLSIVGWGFILLGVVGLFLPFLQGVLFILIGIMILSTQYGWARLLLMKMRKRFPKIARTTDVARTKVQAWMKHLSRRNAN